GSEDRNFDVEEEGGRGAGSCRQAAASRSRWRVGSGPMDLLVCHDGELGDVCALLRELGRDFVERVGPPPLADLARPWALVVTTTTRALRLGSALEQPEARSIVVAEPGTRAAGRRLHQLGVEWIVRRPVHPSAFRALLQYARYPGPAPPRAPRAA